MKAIKKKKPGKFKLFFNLFAAKATTATGSPWAFILAVAIVVVWALTGPLFDFSETWQLVINTGTTIVTFLMVFVIQHAQNKDTVALHLKMNELIAATKGASNRLINIEDLTDEELHVLKSFYIHLSHLSEKNNDLFSTHSLDEAKQNQSEKLHHHSQKKPKTV
jgi:low affinity Fe/Cu permease